MARLIALASPQGQGLARAARLNGLADSLQRQEHPAFCAVASAITVARAEGVRGPVRCASGAEVGPQEQTRFMEVFRSPWPPVMACYGLDALDLLPGIVKSGGPGTASLGSELARYWLLSHLQ